MNTAHDKQYNVWFYIRKDFVHMRHYDRKTGRIDSSFMPYDKHTFRNTVLFRSPRYTYHETVLLDAPHTVLRPLRRLLNLRGRGANE